MGWGDRDNSEKDSFERYSKQGWLGPVGRTLNDEQIRVAHELAVQHDDTQREIEDARNAARALYAKRQAEDRWNELQAKRRK